MARIEENWQVAPTWVKVGFVAGIPAFMIGIALIVISQFFKVPSMLFVAIGAAFLGAGGIGVLQLAQGNFPGGIKSHSDSTH